MEYLEQLEEKIGPIHSEESREDIESVLTRLVVTGIMPEEAVLLTEKLYNAILADLYYPLER